MNEKHYNILKKKKKKNQLKGDNNFENFEYNDKIISG